MDFSLTPLLNEILQGTPRAIIAILVVIIAILIHEVRTYKKDLKENNDRLEEQRKEFLEIFTKNQEKLLQKTESMVDRYHEAIMAQQASTEKLNDTIEIWVQATKGKD